MSGLALWPHRLQHIGLLYPPLSPRVCSNLCPLSQWCYLIISSSAASFSFCLQSFQSSIRVFSSESALCIKWPKYWSFSFSVSPSNECAEISLSVVLDFSNPTDCSLPGSSVHGIQPMDWVVMPFSRGSSYLGIEPRYPALQVASLPPEPPGKPFQWIFRVDFLWDWLVGSPCSARDSQDSSAS